MTPRRGPAPSSVKDEARADLAKHAKVDKHDIQGEYVRVPALLARWLHRLAIANENLGIVELEAKERKARAKLAAEISEAKVRGRVVEAAKHSRPNAETVRAAVVTDYEYERSQTELISAVAAAEREVVVAAADAEVAKAAVEVFQAKREMVVNLGATLRREHEGMPSIRERPRRG